MRDFLARRKPSPAMAVAFVALLAALSGTAVALPGKNTVDSGDLKTGAVKNADLGRNAVTGLKVKNGSLTGSDVRNNSLTGNDVRGLKGGDVNDDSLTGADVNESSLGKVPSAANADTVGGKSASSFESGGETIPFSVRVPGTGEKTIATVGPFRVFARCTANDGGGTDEITELVMTTTDPNSVFDDNNGPENVPWDPADEAVLIQTTGTDPDIEAEGTTATANAVAADGSGVIVHSYALGQNLGGTTDTCYAQGVVTATPAS
jgi:hypothetical protein